MSVLAGRPGPEDLIRIAVVDKARGYWRTVFRRLARDPVSVGCALILVR